MRDMNFILTVSCNDQLISIIDTQGTFICSFPNVDFEDISIESYEPHI